MCIIMANTPQEKGFIVCLSSHKIYSAVLIGLPLVIFICSISCLPEKWGYYGSCIVIVCVRICVHRDFLALTYKPHFFWDLF